MGVVTTIQDLITIAKYGINSIYDAGDKVHKSGNNYSYSSSAKAASNLIAVFPILCSSNTTLETASLMTKTIERKGCISLQLALTSVNANDSETGFDYLRKFHQNISGGTLDDYEMMIARYLEGVQNESSFVLTSDQTKILVEQLKSLYSEHYYEDDYNHITLNDYQVSESVDGYDISINKIMQEADTRGQKNKMPEMTDSDAKKANESIPSLMIVRFTNRDTKIVTEFIIGVKAKLIPTDYMEILGKIYTKNKDGRGLVNLIRATSGEIRVIQDYILAMDRAKDDVLSMKKKGSKETIWKTLENRAVKSKWLTRQNKTNYASAITTIIITSEDADLLYKEENVDIRNVNEAKKFMAAYNLFSLIIVNDAEEYAMFMYDEQDPYFEKLAYTMLERESSDGQYKKIVNLMAKMR